MRVAIYLDDVSNSIDNVMQRSIMAELARNLTGCSVVIIDPACQGHADATKTLLKQDYDILLTYNKTGTNLTVANQTDCSEYVLSKIERKHVAWLTEHPITFYKQYRVSQGNRHYIFPNKSHSFFSQSMGLSGTFSAQLFASTPIPDQPALHSRDFDVCIAAQWRGPPEDLAFWRRTSGKLREFYEDVLYLQENIDSRDTFTAYVAAIKHHGFPETLIPQSSEKLRALYWYARKQERLTLVRDFAASGLRIALIGGEQWKTVIPQSDNVYYIPPLTHHELKKWYQRSRCVVTTNNYNGASERVFDAIAAGALPFTEDSPDLFEILGNDNAVYYRPNNAKDSLERLKATLTSPDFQDITANSRHIFETNHTWAHRATYLNELFNELIQERDAA